MSAHVDKILDRIKKLMALSASGNPHEASNALRKAQALMQAHNLDAVDIAISDVVAHTTTLANSSQKQPKWSILLMNTIQNAFGVKAVFLARAGTVTFYGIKENGQIACYCYQVLSRHLQLGRKNYLAALPPALKKTTKTTRADMYCEGWIGGVYSNITKLVPTSEQRDLIDKACEMQHSTLTKPVVREAKENKYSRRAMIDGYRDGSAVRLNAGMTGKETEKLTHR